MTNLTSSNTRSMNLNESMRVKMTSDTGTPMRSKGRMNYWRENASYSGVVVVKQRLAIWKIFQKIKLPNYQRYCPENWKKAKTFRSKQSKAEWEGNASSISNVQVLVHFMLFPLKKFSLCTNSKNHQQLYFSILDQFKIPRAKSNDCFHQIAMSGSCTGTILSWYLRTYENYRNHEFEYMLCIIRNETKPKPCQLDNPAFAKFLVNNALDIWRTIYSISNNIFQQAKV